MSHFILACQDLIKAMKLGEEFVQCSFAESSLLIIQVMFSCISSI